jgi:hypothetical protein
VIEAEAAAVSVFCTAPEQARLALIGLVRSSQITHSGALTLYRR